MYMQISYTDTIVQVINALERDTVYRFEWKLSRNLENVSLFVKCKFPTKADYVKDGSSLPVKPRKKKKKTPSAKRRARKRQQRFLEKKAAEKATSPRRAASEAVPKEPESVPKELDLSPEIRDQETTDQSVLVESEPSSVTSSSTQLDSQVSSVALPATLHV